MDRGWLVQSDVVMLAMFDTMFEMFNRRTLVTFTKVLDLSKI